MIRSMTGFGEAARELPKGQLRATVKTVNHRFFNAHLKTPYGFDRYEGEIQNWLKGFFSRGHVNLTLVLERNRATGPEGLPQLDLDRARHYWGLLGTLREELGISGEVELSSVLRVGDLFQAPEAPVADEEISPEVIREVVEEAARGALAMREEEGAHLQVDLSGRLLSMEESLAVIELRAPERLVAEWDRLQAAIRELSQQEEVDQDRLAKEIAYMAERWDINEEVVRFRAHLIAFGKKLEEGGGEPVGKRLGFLVQEMHREANTIASKANDLEIGHASVTIREEIERLREQLENVE
ncbi:MAG: YicC/YloC family endoribonuclease [Gemmatimonadota bacterium]